MTINPVRMPAIPPSSAAPVARDLWRVIEDSRQHGLYRATALRHLVGLLSGMNSDVRFQNVERIESLLDDSHWAFPPALVADPLPLAFVDALFNLEPGQRVQIVQRIAFAKPADVCRTLVWQILPERFRNEVGFP